MSDTKMTTTEARQLLEMLKRSLIAELMLPTRGGKEEFDVVGDTNTDIFTICTYRGKIKPKKYDIGARVKKNGILLLELHIAQPMCIIIQTELKLRAVTGISILKSTAEIRHPS